MEIWTWVRCKLHLKWMPRRWLNVDMYSPQEQPEFVVKWVFSPPEVETIPQHSPNRASSELPGFSVKDSPTVQANDGTTKSYCSQPSPSLLPRGQPWAIIILATHFISLCTLDSLWHAWTGHWTHDQIITVLQTLPNQRKTIQPTNQPINTTWHQSG